MATGLVFALQMIAPIGIVMMFMMAAFWSVLLVNAGMIGIAIEAIRGRVVRVWLVVPAVFYGGYLGFAGYDHYVLASLGYSYDAENAKIHVPFDPARQNLVFEKGVSPEWFTQNYALPVAYSANENYPEKYRSTKMVEKEVCSRARADRSLREAGVFPTGFHDGDAIRSRRFETRFCNLSMPEAPMLPLIRISRQETTGKERLLPVRKVTTRITMPDGESFELKGGTASPLSWLPMPVMGCGLNSANPSWDCDWGFARQSFTPIVSGSTRYSRDSISIARVLGLKPVPIAERQGAELPETMRAKMDELQTETLRLQLANVDAMIANPLIEAPDWDIGVLAEDPEALSKRANAIMTGVERAAAIDGADRFKARESGRILARLIAVLPADNFAALKPRILKVYRTAGDGHWLWQSESLLSRLGDLGIDAMPYLTDSRALDGARIEGMCRVGIAGRDLAMPVLIGMWNSSRDRIDRDRRTELFVAMRRMGITPQPLTKDARGQFSDLQSAWADISPQSSPSVCSALEEARLRRIAAVRERRQR